MAVFFEKNEDCAFLIPATSHILYSQHSLIHYADNSDQTCIRESPLQPCFSTCSGKMRAVGSMAVCRFMVDHILMSLIFMLVIQSIRTK
jgi:hypothetical protein